MKRYDITQIQGVIPATLTTFDEKEEIDDRRMRQLIDFQLEHGADGFYLTGSTGLCFTMTTKERMHVVESVIDCVNGRKPVIVHVGDIGTKNTIMLAKHAEQAGADAISSVPPFYWNFSRDDIYQYYKDVSSSVGIPMVVYNIALAGIMDSSLLEQITSLENVKGLKYTARTQDEMGNLKTIKGKDFMVYSGSDEMAFSGFCYGADGIIGSFYNVIPDIFKKIQVAYENDDIKTGIQIQQIADKLIYASLKYDFPSVLHNLLRWRGVDSGYSRRPFRNYSEKEMDPLKEEIRNIRMQPGGEVLDVFNI